MEVHAHSHTERKKWTHYLWEFLMLFLAVFCGFLAENQREHIVEHQKEKQYIQSLISDVKTDTANITEWLLEFNRIKKSCDTVLDNFDSFSKDYSIISARNYFTIIYGYPDFVYTDRTMQQLKNSGGMRLIRNTDAADSIIAYDAAIRGVLIQESLVSQMWTQLIDLTNKMWSYKKSSSEYKTKSPMEMEKQKINFWVKKDPEEFEHLYNLVFKYQKTVYVYTRQLVQLKNEGGRVIDFLQKEYKIK